jgi:DNA-binding NarL/FixJ family response regulator
MTKSATSAEIQAKRDEAVVLFEQGLSNAEIARQLDVARKNVSQWYQLW